MTYGNASISHPRPRFLQHKDSAREIQHTSRRKYLSIYIYRCSVNHVYIYIYDMGNHVYIYICYGLVYKKWKNNKILFFAVSYLIYLPIERINRPIAIKMVAGWLQQPTSMQLPTSGSCSSISEGELSSLLHLLYYQAPPCHECDKCRKKNCLL